MNIVYTMTFSDGSTYVGSTTSFNTRRSNHCRDMRKGRHYTKVQQAFSRCGYPVFDVVACALARSNLHAVEAQVIESIQPKLNTLVPAPVPPTEQARGRPWGPYGTLRAAADDLKVSYRFIKRLSKLSYESAVSKLAYDPHRVPRPKFAFQPHQVEVGGVVAYPKEHRARLGVSHEFYKKCVRSGRNPWKETPQMPTPPRLLQVGSETKTLSEWAELAGVRVDTLRARLDQSMWTPEQAVGRAPPPRQKYAFPADRRTTFVVDGVTRTLREWATLAGAKEGTVRQRLSAGWTPRQAVGFDPKPPRRRGSQV